MKNIKEYLLLALALVLGSIALLKLTQGDLLYVPVAQVKVTRSYVVTAYPILTRGDTKEKDPLGLLGTKLTFTPPQGVHPGAAKVFGKIYPLQNKSLKIDHKIDKPIEITLLEQKTYCAIPVSAVVQIGEKSYILTKKGVQKITIAETFGDDLYITPPCPQKVAIGKNLKKRIKESLYHQ